MKFSQSTSMAFCSFPWKFNPMYFSFLVHFPALELFIHPPSALPLSKYSRPIPMAVMCCQYFNNVTITQLSPAPSSQCRISVPWKSLCAETGKLLPQPRKKAHSAALYCHCKSLPCTSQTRMEKGCQHYQHGCHSYLTLGVKGNRKTTNHSIFFKLLEKLSEGKSYHLPFLYSHLLRTLIHIHVSI